MKRYEYDAILHETPDSGGAYVVFPLDLRQEFGKGRGGRHGGFGGNMQQQAPQQQNPQDTAPQQAPDAPAEPNGNNT